MHYILCHLLPWPSVDIRGKFYRNHLKENTSVRGLNAREVAKYRNFVPIEGYTSETVQDRR